MNALRLTFDSVRAADGSLTRGRTPSHSDKETVRLIDPVFLSFVLLSLAGRVY